MDNMEISSIASAIVEDYGHGRAIDKLVLHNHPDKEAIIQIIDKLLGIVYAGYYRKREVKLFDARTGIKVMVEDCIFRLQRQIMTVLPYRKDWENKTEDELSEEAMKLTCEFFRRLPEVRALLDTDLQAILEGDPAAANKDEIIMAYPGFFTITVYRLAHVLFELGVPMIPRIMSEHAHSLTGIDIHPGAAIDAYFFIDHGTGIVIGETTIIAQHVKIYQGVTLGALSTRGGQSLKGVKRHPTIEENVTIYAGASVLGNTVIGHDSVIGSNVFITEDMPAGTKVSVKKQDWSIRTQQNK